MTIQIQYPNAKFDVVKTTMLGRMLAQNQVSKFKRRSGWVVVGVDPIRVGHKPYDGAERRAS